MVQMPHEIVNFKVLQQLTFHHVSIKQWRETEALTHSTHPFLMRMAFYHVELPDNGTIPPGLSNYNFPLMNSLGFYHTPIQVFPSQIGNSWAYIPNIMMEYCNITMFPNYFFDTLSSDEYNYEISNYLYYYGYGFDRKLSLVGNALTNVPSEMFLSSKFQIIHLDLNPLQELPDSVLQKLYKSVTLTGTQLTKWPEKMEFSALSESLTKYYDASVVASNTPLCIERPTIFLYDPSMDEILYRRICFKENFKGYLDPLSLQRYT
jgi:hypothetical protein